MRASTSLGRKSGRAPAALPFPSLQFQHYTHTFKSTADMLLNFLLTPYSTSKARNTRTVSLKTDAYLQANRQHIASYDQVWAKMAHAISCADLADTNWRSEMWFCREKKYQASGSDLTMMLASKFLVDQWSSGIMILSEQSL
jgi:hypothetical protein